METNSIRYHHYHMINSIFPFGKPGRKCFKENYETKISRRKLQQINNKEIVLQWIPGHCQIHWLKKGARILQTHSNDLSYHSVKLYIRQLKKNCRKKTLNKKLRTNSGKGKLLDCLGKHLHHIGLWDNPFCMLCGPQEDMDRNHLQRCAALSGTTECERYWEARTKMSTVL